AKTKTKRQQLRAAQPDPPPSFSLVVSLRLHSSRAARHHRRPVITGSPTEAVYSLFRLISMADLRFSTFNGSSAAASPGYANRVYLTTERSPHSVDVSYQGGGEVGGGVQYSREYRTEVRTIESAQPAKVSVDLSSPYSLANPSFDVRCWLRILWGGGAAKSRVSFGSIAASSDSRRLAGQLEYRQQQRQPPPPPPDLDDYANLPPQQHRYEFSTSTSSRQVGGGGGGGDVRLGSTSNISGPRSPQYVNGIVGGGAGGGVGYDYTVT
uniref:MHD domain-containing protein n=1 Tax=Macrostomum lignano TaxID=282301 RepID=A0A1I8G6X6_9PLAT